MSSEISLFSQESFIKASKKFVCVKLGTYESKQHQDQIRTLLDGRMENTAFVIFAPDGKTKLTRSGRSPKQVFGKNTIQEMKKIAAKYRAINLDKPATLTDFNSFKQSLNAASADQRLLVFATSSKEQHSSILKNLTIIFNDPEVTGRFFYDIAGAQDANWAEKIKNASKENGIFIIQSDTYGQTGTVVAELSVNAALADIKTALINANIKFADNEKRKIYSEHVTTGKQDGINFENNMKAGEDRDGDGIIDPKPTRGRKTPAYRARN